MSNHINEYWNRFKFVLSYFVALEKCKTFPIVTNIETTNHCPMSCKMCPRTYRMGREKGVMSMSLFENICKQISDYKYMMTTPPDHIILLHHFGEPLLDKMLVKRLRLGSKYNLSFGLSTNAQFLTPDLTDQLLTNGLKLLYFSLDATNQETMEYYRGEKADYAQAVSNIDYILKQKAKKRLKFPIIKIGMIEMERTKPYTDIFINTWTRAGVDEVMIKPFESFDGSSEEVKKIGNQEGKNTRQRCVAPWREVAIIWDGRVVPCCADYNANYVLGNLNEKSLLTIWNDQPAQMLRREHRAKIIKNSLCRDCVDKKNFGRQGRFLVSLIDKINSNSESVN